MRDPKRIPKILKRIEEVWKRHPDMRLGQLIENVYPNTPVDYIPAYYEEDEPFIKTIEDFYSEKRIFRRFGKRTYYKIQERLINRMKILYKQCKFFSKLMKEKKIKSYSHIGQTHLWSAFETLCEIADIDSCWIFDDITGRNSECNPDTKEKSQAMIKLLKTEVIKERELGLLTKEDLELAAKVFREKICPVDK